MSEYTYEGVDRSGQRVTGKVEVTGEGELRMLLRQKGVRPTKILKGTGLLPTQATPSDSSKNSVRLGLAELSLLTRQLQLLISSGVPLLEGIGLLCEQAQDKKLKSVLETLRENISKGSFFWEALALFPGTFPKLYVALVRAGESSGSLDQMLKRLGRYLENSERVRRMIKGAMMYPIIVLSIAVGVIALMLIFVIPKFEEMLKGGGQSLPAPTAFVIWLSHSVISNIHFIIPGVIAFGYGLVQYLRTNEGRALLDRVSLKMPVVGHIVLKGSIARFCRTLQTLLMAGVNVIDAVDICRATVDNVAIEGSISGLRAEIETGKTLGTVLARVDFFPKMAVQMISIGEATGNIDKMLEKVADYYEDEVEVLVGGLSKAFEPILLVFLGGTVGGMLIAMYLPIFKIAGGAE